MNLLLKWNSPCPQVSCLSEGHVCTSSSWLGGSTRIERPFPPRAQGLHHRDAFPLVGVPLSYVTPLCTLQEDRAGDAQ